MKVTILIENTAVREDLAAEHGLSIYVETPHHCLLMDTGASGAFAENAGKLGVDLRRVDTLVLSHGHYDHGGGVKEFARLNPEAGIYVRENAFGSFYAEDPGEYRYIGLDPQIESLPQLVKVKGDLVIDGELSLYTNVCGKKLWPAGNRVLKERAPRGYVQDSFAHEQYLVIAAEGREVLISGCAHNGIVNILEEVSRRRGRVPDVVFSGFHLMKGDGYSAGDLEIIREVTEELSRYPSRFYTGHCTSQIPYETLADILGEQLACMSGGMTVEI